MNEIEDNKKQINIWVYIGSAILIVFLPLMIAGIESIIFKTYKTEEFCKTIGIHGILDAIYEPIFEALRYITKLF